MGIRLEIDIPEHHYNNIMAFDSVSFGRVPYKGIIMYAINAIKHGKVLDQEPTTKNNLGADAISRADAIKAMQDKAKKLTNEDTINGLCGAVAILYEMPSVTPTSKECVDCVSRQAVLEITAETGALETQRRVKALPPVTPIRPKGHWIDIDETHSKCSGCGAVFGIYSANGEVNYCPNCGADMREVEE